MILVCYKENVALGKTVWEDQEWMGTYDWKGDKAVDGRYDNRSAMGGQCVISENRIRKATLRVDLVDMVNISHINIYYRTDNLPRMFFNHSLLVLWFLLYSRGLS